MVTTTDVRIAMGVMYLLALTLAIVQFMYQAYDGSSPRCVERLPSDGGCTPGSEALPLTMTGAVYWA